MATQAQINANRRTDAQSTIRNPQSAIRPGLLAKVVPAETEGWNELLTGLYESLRPQDELQRFLVEQVAHCILRLQRAAASEERWLVGSRVIPVPEGRQYEGEESPGLAPPAFARIDPFLCGEHCRTLLRYEAAANRQIHKNLALLQKLQSAPKPTRQPECPYLLDMDDLEGAAPSAPDRWGRTRPEDVRTIAPQPGSPGLAAFQPGPSGPGDECGGTDNLPVTEHRCGLAPSPLEGESGMPAPEAFGEGRQDGLYTVADNELASFRNNGVNAIYNGREKDGG